MQGQVRYHSFSISDGKISAIPYIRLDNSVEIGGFQATEHKVRNTQTICPTYSSDEKFGNAEQIFRRLEGHQVLIDINNDSYDVQFATDSVCSFQTHTREECDLVNYGWVTYVTNFEVKDLGNTQ